MIYEDVVYCGEILRQMSRYITDVTVTSNHPPGGTSYPLQILFTSKYNTNNRIIFELMISQGNLMHKGVLYLMVLLLNASFWSFECTTEDL